MESDGWITVYPDLWRYGATARENKVMAEALIEIAVRNGPRGCFCPVGGKRDYGCPGDRDPLNEDEPNKEYITAARALGIL